MFDIRNSHKNRHRRHYCIRKPKFKHLRARFHFLPGEWMLIAPQKNQLQQELRNKHQELKRAFNQLAQRTQELEIAQNELKEKNKDISELSAQTRATSALATIAEITAELTHQLNNPLAAATGASRQLNKILDTESNKKAVEMLSLLTSSLKRMKQTLDDVHIIYRQSRMPISPEENIDVSEQIYSTLSLLEHRLCNMTVKTHVPDSLPPVRGHLSLFQHVIINLLDNAIDAAGPNGILKITIKKTEERIAISVSDNGPGVPTHLRDKIFEPFYSLKEKGSGLGLTAVKRYVEQDQATINVSDSSYGGTKFTICYRIKENSERMTI